MSISTGERPDENLSRGTGGLSLENVEQTRILLHVGQVIDSQTKGDDDQAAEGGHDDADIDQGGAHGSHIGFGRIQQRRGRGQELSEVRRGHSAHNQRGHHDKHSGYRGNELGDARVFADALPNCLIWRYELGNLSHNTAWARIGQGDDLTANLEGQEELSHKRQPATGSDGTTIQTDC